MGDLSIPSITDDRLFTLQLPAHELGEPQPLVVSILSPQHTADHLVSSSPQGGEEPFYSPPTVKSSIVSSASAVSLPPAPSQLWVKAPFEWANKAQGFLSPRMENGKQLMIPITDILIIWDDMSTGRLKYFFHSVDLSASQSVHQSRPFAQSVMKSFWRLALTV